MLLFITFQGEKGYMTMLLAQIAFCIPYGMISAELGTTYQSEGGMYDWVKRAFGAKWAARVAWNYWINFPLWIASLAVAVTDVIAGIMEIELSLGWLLVLQLGYTWLVSFLGTQRIGESKWIVNIGTFFKILFMVGLGALGIYVYMVLLCSIKSFGVAYLSTERRFSAEALVAATMTAIGYLTLFDLAVASKYMIASVMYLIFLFADTLFLPETPFAAPGYLALSVILLYSRGNN